MVEVMVRKFDISNDTVQQMWSDS